MTHTGVTETRNLRLDREDGHVDVTIYRYNGEVCFKLVDNGTSSCVASIKGRTNGYVSVDWNGTSYTYKVDSTLVVLTEFIMTLSLGKTGNWVKAHNIMPVAEQAALSVR
jgi:hypothetical protein